MSDSYVCTVQIQNPSRLKLLKIVGDFPQVEGIDIQPRGSIEIELDVSTEFKPWVRRYLDTNGTPCVYLGIVDKNV